MYIRMCVCVRVCMHYSSHLHWILAWSQRAISSYSSRNKRTAIPVTGAKGGGINVRGIMGDGAVQVFFFFITVSMEDRLRNDCRLEMESGGET